MCGILGEYLCEHMGELEKHVGNIAEKILKFKIVEIPLKIEDMFGPNIWDKVWSYWEHIGEPFWEPDDNPLGTP
jgi:hypothetical protein